jgi:hypothetical protein
VEDAKRALFLYGNDTSKTVKEVLTDLHKIKGVSNTSAMESACRAAIGRFIHAGLPSWQAVWAVTDRGVSAVLVAHAAAVAIPSGVVASQQDGSCTSSSWWAGTVGSV